jgi:hypothetical protein
VTLSFKSLAEKFFVEMQAEREGNKKIKSHIAVAGLTLAVCAYVGAVGTTAAAATLWTSNVGSDSASCGASASPCRSISQAIVNATDGDTIWVGPGHYGDVNGDGNFTGPGDEQPDPNAGNDNDEVSGCIVCITKALHIYSTDGAALTIIEASGSIGIPSTVTILHDGVDFGAEDHGFTITGGNAYGVTIAPAYNVLQDITIKGNIDIGDGEGFYARGIDENPVGWEACGFFHHCQFNARILVAGNRAIGNTTGFHVILNSWIGPGYIVLRDNEALGDTTGFFVYPVFVLTPETLVFSARNVQLVNNIAAHGGTGFYADLPGDVTYNTALDNSQSGFTMTPGGGKFAHNAAIGNGGPGMIVNLSASASDAGVGNSFSTLSDNNFLGNDRKRAALFLGVGLYFSPSFSLGPSAHCGILNLGALEALYGPGEVTPVPATQLRAANNYWGSSTGPSGSGPGDNAGGACDQDNSTTIAKPFSPTKFGSTVTPTVLEN